MDALKESGVVVTKGGRHYWYESLDTRVYENEFEAKLALNHSVNVASGLKHLVESGRTYFVGGERMFSNPEHMKPALMHLRTGSDKIFEIFENSENTKRRAGA